MQRASERNALWRWMKSVQMRAEWLLGVGLILALAGCLLSLGEARAQSATPADAPLDVRLSQYLVVKGPDGKEHRESAEKIRPGDVIEYEAVYRNHSGRRLDHVVANLPLPDQLEYVQGTASPASALAATKEGVKRDAFARAPLMRSVKKAGGSVVEEPVPAAEYAALRWKLPGLASGEQFVVHARMQLPALATTAMAAPAGQSAR